MNIVLTGHKGLIGSFLKKRLEEEGHKIVLSVDLKEGNDVKDLEDYLIEDKVDMVIHCAAFCKVVRIFEDPSKGFGNASDSYSIFEFCRKNKIPKIVYFSSTRVLSEEKNLYTAGKIYGEELCKSYKECYGIDYLIIRPSTVYGPFWDETRRLMHIYITNALRNKNLKIFGDPETKTLDFTYVDDFVDGIMLAIYGEWNKEYNISGNCETKLYDLAKFIINETDSKGQINIFDADIAQPQKVKVDISEIQKLGYNPKISLWGGVRKNIDFLRNIIPSQSS
jgi:nucleoside-diphosphate-sugar epimerase